MQVQNNTKFKNTQPALSSRQFTIYWGVCVGGVAQQHQESTSVFSIEHSNLNRFFLPHPPVLGRPI